MQLRTLISALALAASAFSAAAHDYQAGDIRIGHPYARATMPGQPSGAVYMALENRGKSADKLVEAATPVAKKTEIHTMSMDGNVMKMRQVDGIELAPAATVTMKPGDGYHVMLLGLQQPLKAGDKLPLTLTFEKAGKVDVSVVVQDAGKAPMAGHGQHQH
ncbi:MAG: copper chaperone PCu(A)C [Burkholderiaceae bacterium]